MSETTINSCERQESSLSKAPEQQGRLQCDLGDVAIDQQRQVLDGERRRVSATTQHYLPNLVLGDGPTSLLPEKDPKVAADADKRKLELQMQNQTIQANDGNNQSRSFPQNGICPPSTANRDFRSSALRPLFERNMLRLDADRDGFVSGSEIDAAVTDPTYTGQDAQLVTVLHEHRQELEELSNDEIGDENDGVTLDDIRQFDTQLSERTAVGQMTAAGTNQFDGIDADRDGYLSALELDLAALVPGITADYRQALQTMRARIEDIEEASNDELGDENDGITRADLQGYYQGVWNNSTNELFTAVDGTFYGSGESISMGCRSLYSTANPLDSIRPQAIDQGSIGDCYLLAAMGSLANDPVGRQQLYNMIRDNGNGTYTVTFPGAPDEPITVTAPTDAETALYAQGNKMGMWPAILERAYGTYCQQHPERRSPLNPDGGSTPAEGADGGSWTHDGIRILTGRGVDIDINQLASEDQLALHLQQAMAEHRPVTCSTGVEQTDDIGLTDAQGLPDRHEYSVLAYDPVTRLVTIRNPWGHSEPTGHSDGNDDGIFVMTLSEYRRAFIQTAYAERA